MQAALCLQRVRKQGGREKKRGETIILFFFPLFSSLRSHSTLKVSNYVEGRRGGGDNSKDPNGFKDAFTKVSFT